jgi:exonuclease III
MTANLANTSRGGSAIIIKKEISHFMENKYEKDKIQSTAVKIRTKKQNITIAAAYCPPGRVFCYSWRKIYSGRRL